MTDFAKELAISSGRIPPNAVEFEKLVLGTCLIDSKGLKETVKVLKDNFEVFYDPRHKEIYRAISFLHAKNNPIDLMTVIMQLKKTDELSRAGGDHYIIDLTMGISSSAHIEYHLRIVWEKYILRTLINSASLTIQKAFDEKSDVFEVLEHNTKEITKVHNYLSGQKPIKSFLDVHQEFIGYVKSKATSGIAMPFKKLQEENQGWQNSDLIILAARPGMGKTALALKFAKHAAKNDLPVHLISLEMANLQLHKRIISDELEINSNHIRKKEFDEIDLQKVFDTSEIENMPLYYDDTIMVWEEMKSRIKLVHEEKKTKLIIIDYLQLISTKAKLSTIDRVSLVSRELKLLAKELNVPIICLSQLSRAVEQRPNKKPMLSDLRESGAIEQDADLIFFLYRPEYYGIEVWDEEEENETETKGKALLINAKNRHCGESQLVIGWKPEFQRFYDLHYKDFGNFEKIKSATLNEAFGNDKDEYMPF